jgi:hypothetical protein
MSKDPKEQLNETIQSLEKVLGVSIPSKQYQKCAYSGEKNCTCKFCNASVKMANLIFGGMLKDINNEKQVG